MCAEEGKSISGAYVQNKECREILPQEKKGGEKAKKTSEAKPDGAPEKQGTAMKGEAETVDATVKSDVGGEEPKDQVSASESELGTTVLEQLSGQDEVSPAVAAEAGSDVSESHAYNSSEQWFS